MILDTGPLVAAANRKDPDHEACRDLLAHVTDMLTVPALVVAEATFLIERAGGPAVEARFLRSLSSRRYRVETSLIALAERMGEATIATLDRRHFRVVRPKHAVAFTLLP